jgi:hypothetical protein
MAARKPRALSSYAGDTTLDRYEPSRQSEYLYRPYTSATDARVQRWQVANSTSDLPNSAQYAAIVMTEQGITYEKYLDDLTRADMRTGFSLDGKPTPAWAGGSKQAYHRAVRANQRRIDGQPPVDESAVRIPGVPVTLDEAGTLTSTSSGEASASSSSMTNALNQAQNWAADNKPIIIGAAALALLVLLARKR